MAGLTTNGLPYPTGTDLVKDGDTAIQVLAEAVDTKTGQGAWKAYTPTLTAGAIGSGGVLEGHYIQQGRTVHFRARAKFGTGLAMASGMALTLPKPRFAASYDLMIPVALLDAGNTNYMAIGYMGTDRVGVWLLNATFSLAAISGTAPFTWAANDEIWMAATYETTTG